MLEDDVHLVRTAALIRTKHHRVRRVSVERIRVVLVGVQVLQVRTTAFQPFFLARFELKRETVGRIERGRQRLGHAVVLRLLRKVQPVVIRILRLLRDRLTYIARNERSFESVTHRDARFVPSTAVAPRRRFPSRRRRASLARSRISVSPRAVSLAPLPRAPRRPLDPSRASARPSRAPRAVLARRVPIARASSLARYAIESSSKPPSIAMAVSDASRVALAHPCTWPRSSASIPRARRRRTSR